MATSPFDSALERREASVFGMWVFLATEVLFFGPLFFNYLYGRLYQPDAWVSASHKMHVVLGTINTALLLTSSFTVALAVHASREGRTSRLRTWLGLTVLLGLGFLGVKSVEYWSEISELMHIHGGEARFFFLYFAMTGLHAGHLTIGVCLVSWLWWNARRFGPQYHAPVEVTALYWHFVDVVWVFLYPLFYLISRYNA